ncbi:MAG: type II secretion system GspH family protein [Lentisphaeraceae bacterium]|nr:type II secretion system GspH family protein [Lentisphaeraceae bacterium]
MKKCFTLIELLVVVAIIGLLVSILLPSLSKAREATKTAVCVSNIAQIQRAIQLYASNESSRMPADYSNASSRKLMNTWPSFVDQYLGGPTFSGANGQSVTGMSDIWNGCPNGVNTLRDPIYFQDSDYAGIFPRWPQVWPKSIAQIDNPASSALITEGNHEQGTGPVGNSWIIVGKNASEDEYNNITGISWGRVRHNFGKDFTLSFTDGSARSTKWLQLTIFSGKWGTWVNEY